MGKLLKANTTNKQLQASKTSAVKVSKVGAGISRKLVFWKIIISFSLLSQLLNTHG
jgi:hypothetical protein